MFQQVSLKQKPVGSNIFLNKADSIIELVRLILFRKTIQNKSVKPHHSFNYLFCVLCFLVKCKLLLYFIIFHFLNNFCLTVFFCSWCPGNQCIIPPKLKKFISINIWTIIFLHSAFLCTIFQATCCVCKWNCYTAATWEALDTFSYLLWHAFFTFCPVRPIITLLQRSFNATADRGEAITLFCKAVGSPEPEINWYR